MQSIKNLRSAPAAASAALLALSALAAGTAQALPVTYTFVVDASISAPAPYNGLATVTATGDTDDIVTSTVPGYGEVFVLAPKSIQVEFGGTTFYGKPADYVVGSIVEADQYTSLRNIGVGLANGLVPLFGVRPFGNFATALPLDADYETTGVDNASSSVVAGTFQVHATADFTDPAISVTTGNNTAYIAEVRLKIDVTEPPPPPSEVDFGSFTGTAYKKTEKKNAEVEFKGSIVLGAGTNGLDLAGDALEFTIGEYTLAVPAGGLVSSVRHPGVWRYKRKARGVEESVTVSFQDDATYHVAVEIEAPAAALQAIAPRRNAVVALAIGDDMGTTTVPVRR
ncbi:MAG: hypothetical protein RL026_393 [Pseudomonadota bacterium]|jgi:hypothetical protein